MKIRFPLGVSGRHIVSLEDSRCPTAPGETPEGVYCTLAQACLRLGFVDRKNLKAHAAHVGVKLVRAGRELGFATYADYRRVADSTYFSLPGANRRQA